MERSGCKAQRSGPASAQVGTGCSNNIQLHPPPPPTSLGFSTGAGAVHVAAINATCVRAHNKGRARKELELCVLTQVALIAASCTPLTPGLISGGCRDGGWVFWHCTNPLGGGGPRRVLPILRWCSLLTQRYSGVPITISQVACLSVPHMWLGNSHMALGTWHQSSHSHGCGPSASLTDLSESRLAGRRLSRPVGSGCVSLPPRHSHKGECQTLAPGFLLVSVQCGWWFWSDVWSHPGDSHWKWELVWGVLSPCPCLAMMSWWLLLYYVGWRQSCGLWDDGMCSLNIYWCESISYRPL